MEQLVGECVQFIADNLEGLMELKMDLTNNSEDILARLARVRRCSRRSARLGGPFVELVLWCFIMILPKHQYSMCHNHLWERHQVFQLIDKTLDRVPYRGFYCSPSALNVELPIASCFCFV